jgi:small-conductance mechanosensitive channel
MADALQAVSGWFEQTLGVTPGVQQNLVYTLLAWAVYLVLRLLVTGFIERRVSEVARRYIATKTVNYVLGALFFVATLIIWFGGFTGWSAYLGIVSAGLAIALQDPLTNLAGWLFISVRKPFVVGDRIEIGGHAGDVIDLRPFQFTLIEIGNWVHADQSTGRLIHVPNGWVFKHTTANFTAGFEFIWNELPVLVTFESDWRRAKAILLEIAGRHTDVADAEAAQQVPVSYTHLTLPTTPYV